MKTININGEQCTVIESIDDVLAYNSGKEIEFVEEYRGYYFIRFKPEHFYDEAMYKVEINTGKAECIHLIDYFIEVEGNGKRIDPSTIRRAV